MTISLKTVGRRFESNLQTVSGIPFLGTIEPMDEGTVASYDFGEARLIMRVRTTCPIGSKTLIKDPSGRIFLTADHDIGILRDNTIYRTHRLFLMNHQAKWERESSGNDALTGLKKGSGLQDLGQIHILIEPSGRAEMDLTMRIPNTVRRVIVGEDVQLGDLLDGKKVSRLDKVLGVWLAEVAQ